jgi:periplasmic divalent cation tolerance protein
MPHPTFAITRTLFEGRPAMLESNPSARIVLTTTANTEDANRLGRTLVEERLAACATMIQPVQSIYRWQETVETSTETLLLLKTATDQLVALEERLHQLHPYQIPEFLVLSVESISTLYFDWIKSNLRSP